MSCECCGILKSGSLSRQWAAQVLIGIPLGDDCCLASVPGKGNGLLEICTDDGELMTCLVHGPVKMPWNCLGAARTHRVLNQQVSEQCLRVSVFTNGSVGTSAITVPGFEKLLPL